MTIVDRDAAAILAVLARLEASVRVEDDPLLMDWLHRHLKELDLVSGNGDEKTAEVAAALLALNHRLRAARGEHEGIP
ncbi:hypothetical protein [Streptacidiphilus monticola]|uniref:Uncharacterized protein n=1 Tax=Streptacidiphilus monticola TaxID=2161674 RepID=A0ABW1GB38_9ACTN